MKSLSWMIGLLGISIVIQGCTYSPGPWGGQLEEIMEYEPILIVVEEEARLEVEPVAPLPRPKTKPRSRPLSAVSPDIEPILETEPEQAKLETEPEQATVTQVQVMSDRVESVINVIPEKPQNQTSDNDVVSVIEAISKIESNSTKRRLYIAIAKRDDLNDQGQIALVNSAFDTLFSETAVEDVIITMIQNPNFSDAGKEAIIKRVDDFFSDSSKKRILGALPNE